MSKIHIFPKGLTHVFGPKMAILSNFFFQAIQARKMSFTRFYNEKTPFQATKTRSSKTRKIDVFTKGLTPGFGLKMTIILTCFFKQYRQGKCVLPYFTTKKLVSRLKKQEVQKLEKLTFLQRVKPWFWSKNGHFFKLFFFRQYRPGKCLL